MLSLNNFCSLLYRNLIGNSGFWCLITTENQTANQILWNYMIYVYIPLYVILFFNLFCFWRSLINLDREYKDAPELKKRIIRFYVYPFIGIFALTIGLIDRIFNSLGYTYFILVLCHVCFTNGLGLWNALYFGINRRKQIKECFLSICSSKQNTQSYDSMPYSLHTVNHSNEGSLHILIPNNE